MRSLTALAILARALNQGCATLEAGPSIQSGIPSTTSRAIDSASKRLSCQCAPPPRAATMANGAWTWGTSRSARRARSTAGASSSTVGSGSGSCSSSGGGGRSPRSSVLNSSSTAAMPSWSLTADPSGGTRSDGPAWKGPRVDPPARATEGRPADRRRQDRRVRRRQLTAGGHLGRRPWATGALARRAGGRRSTGARARRGARSWCDCDGVASGSSTRADGPGEVQRRERGSS